MKVTQWKRAEQKYLNLIYDPELNYHFTGRCHIKTSTYMYREK